MKEEYNWFKNQFCKVGTHIFICGSETNDYKVFEYEITNKMQVDLFNYLQVLLKDVNGGSSVWYRFEWLIMGTHTHKGCYLAKEEAERYRMELLNSKSIKQPFERNI